MFAEKIMNKLKLFLLPSFICQLAFAQVGVNTISPSPSAALDINSPNNNTGLLIPRLTSLQRTSISSPADGLLVYDTDGKTFYYYDQSISKWLVLSPWKTEATATTHTIVCTSGLITNVGINTPFPTQKLEVTGNAKINGTVLSTGITNTGIISTTSVTAQTLSVAGFPINSLLPAGAIIMWSGGAAPSGWHLCDGLAGTPDLRGRFIVSTGQNQSPAAGDINPTYSYGNTGGENTHLLTSTESGLPSHTHTTQPHNHSFGDYINNATHNCIASGGSTCTFETLYTTPNTSNNSSVTVDAVSAQNASQAHENRPPYYVLAFIMKLP